jgi:hypothetical protein
MRTTVTLEPDVARKIKELARRRCASFAAMLNEVLRRGVARSAPTPRFVVEAPARGFRPGIDATKLNELVDELEVEDFAAETRAGK